MQTYDRLEHSHPEHRDYFVVNWCIGNTCNYSCSYCPESLHNGSLPFVELEAAIRFCDRVLEHYRSLDPNKKFYFEFTGGEVTLWKHFLDLAKYLKSKDCKVGLISNGSRSLDYWAKAAEVVDHACISFHPESAKQDHFLSVVRFMAEKVRLHVNIMMWPEKFAECWSFAETVTGVDNISMAIQPLIVDFDRDLYQYTDEQKERMEKQHNLLIKNIKHSKTFESYRGAMTKVAGLQRKNAAPQVLIAANENNWRGWYCSAGLEQIVVNMDGKISRGWCLEGKKIGHIWDEDIHFPTSEVKCGKSVCHCNFDIMSTKRREVENGLHAR